MTEVKLVPRNEVEEKYTWDMSLLYKTNEEYLLAVEKFKKSVIEFSDKFSGELKDEVIIDLSIKEYEELIFEYSKLFHYAELPMAVDRFSEQVQKNAAVFEEVSNIWADKSSVYSTKLTNLKESIIDIFVENYRPDLKYFFEKIKRNKKYTLSEEVEKVISNFESLPEYYNLYEVTKHEDMKFKKFEAEGREYENSFVLYENLHEMDNNKEIRRNAARSFYETLNSYKNTVANEYISKIKKEKMLANLRGYDSVIDYLLASQDGDRSLYDRQIKVLMEDLAPHIRRYIKLLAKEHKIEDMTFADCKINLDPDFEVDMTIEESREYLKKALGILGENYKALIDESYDKRWTDFPQNIGKSTGGFCATVPKIAAFILLSWTGKMNEVFVLAHELGHAYHFMSTGNTQSMLNYDCPLYFVEAPSTCNEVIVSNYLLKTNKDSRFKRWVISNMISRTYFHNMVTHYLEAVYQDRIYKKVDNNEMLNADILSSVKREVMEEFFGDSLEINEGAELTWMRQPHYYMGLYPYTYSAGLTIGTAIANKIEKDPSQVNTWLDTLSKGSSMSALDLSKLAGCDVSTEQPLQEAIAYVGYLVDELYNLTEELNR